MRYVFDTNVYVDMSEHSAFAVQAEAFVRRIRGQIAVSSVVRAELEIGTRPTARMPKQAQGPLTTERLITPIHDDWVQAGRALRSLGGHDVMPRRSFWNDLLLAASCARYGYMLITSNRDDFRRIARAIPVRAVAPWPP